MTSMMQRHVLEEFGDVLRVCVDLYDGNHHCVEHQDCKKRNKTFMVNFCRTTPYQNVSVLLGDASLLRTCTKIMAK